jgi:chitinase
MLYYILYILYNVCYIIEYIPGLFTWSNNFTAGLNMDRNNFNNILYFLLFFNI